MHTLRTSLLLCMLIYINYAGSEALSLLNQMQPKFKEESELGTEDLIYKQVTEQLKQQKPYLQIDEEDTKNEVSFREFYKNVRSGKHELVEDEEIDVVEPDHKEIEIQSYLQELSDGLEPQTENVKETELQTDPEKLGKFKKYFIKEDENKEQVIIVTNVEDNQPIEKKMTLREKLEMKKKQAQQSSAVAAIQIKQEVNNQEQITKQSDENISKTTLIKKIEEFKKLKQSKETQENQQSKEENVKEQNIKTVPENPLRKLLNKKAEERKEQELKQQIEQDKQLGQTQEVQIELKQVDVEDTVKTIYILSFLNFLYFQDQEYFVYQSYMFLKCKLDLLLTGQKIGFYTVFNWFYTQVFVEFFNIFINNRIKIWIFSLNFTRKILFELLLRVQTKQSLLIKIKLSSFIWENFYLCSFLQFLIFILLISIIFLKCLAHKS